MQGRGAVNAHEELTGVLVDSGGSIRSSGCLMVANGDWGLLGAKGTIRAAGHGDGHSGRI